MRQKSDPVFTWMYFYMIGLTVLICFLNLICYPIPELFLLFLLFISLTGMILIWRRTLTRRLLLFNNLLLLLFPLCLSHLLLSHFITSVDAVMQVVSAIAVMDVISFTRAGRHTLNAKLVANRSALSRLSICLPVPKRPGLQPIIGVGDMFYYSFITTYFVGSASDMDALTAIFLLCAGQLTNIICILHMRKRAGYKGFPATIFPGVFILIASAFHFI